MPLVAAVIGVSVAVLFGTVVIDAEMERLITAALTTVNTVMLVWQSRKVKRAEGAVDDLHALTRRKLGDREPAASPEPWDGHTERRRHG